MAIQVKIQMSLFFVLNHSFWGQDITLSLGSRLVGMICAYNYLMMDLGHKHRAVAVGEGCFSIASTSIDSEQPLRFTCQPYRKCEDVYAIGRVMEVLTEKKLKGLLSLYNG